MPLRKSSHWIMAALLAGSLCLGQTGTGKIQGTINDASGAVIAGAKVTAVHVPTSRPYHTTTNEVGFYVFPSVQNGPYTLTVEAAGMETYKGEFLLQAGQTAVVDAALKVGSTSTEVKVVADAAPLVTTTAATLANVTDRARIDQLPVNGRRYSTLVTATTPGMAGNATYPYVWGIRWGVEFLQDGAVTMSRQFGTLSNRPPGMDTIEEFRVETNNSSARTNRPGTVIVTTRAGTNQFHGSLFEVMRNNDLGFGVARQRQDKWTRPPHLVRNEFGASGGGPVYLPKVYNGRNKTFFFHSFEALRSMSATTNGTQIPTQQMWQGNFSGLVDGSGRAYTIYDPWTTTSTWSRTPYANNTIPMSRQSPLAKYFNSVTPMPTEVGVNPLVAVNYWFRAPNNTTEWTMTTRVDHRLSDRDQLFFRYSHGVQNVFQFSGVNNAPMTLDNSTNATLSPSRNNTGVASWTHTFSPTFFGETLFTVGSDDTWSSNIGDDKDWDAQLGLPNPFSRLGFPRFRSLGTSLAYGPNNNPQSALATIYHIDENLTKVHGRHEIQFGGRLRYESLINAPAQQAPQGEHTLNGQFTGLYDPKSGTTYGATPYTGYNFADLFLGTVNRYTATFVRQWFNMDMKEYALYIQDNFKVNARLTLNFGMRWEMCTPLRETDHNLSGFDPKSLSMVQQSDLDTMYKIGATIPSIAKAYQNLGVKFISPQQAGWPDQMMYLNKWDFNPRFGFAYKLSAGARPVVVRGGYAIFGSPTRLRATNEGVRRNPPTTAIFANDSSDSAQTPDALPNYALRSVPTVIAGVNSANVIDVNNPTGMTPGSFIVYYFDPKQPTTRAHQWNLTFEREFLENMVVKAGYVGTHGSRLDMYSALNEAPNDYIWFTREGVAKPTGIYAGTLMRTYGGNTYGSIYDYTKNGWSNAQNFQFEIQRRYSKGWGFQFFYVLSNTLKAGGFGWESDILPPTNQFLPGAVPTDDNARARLLYYQRSSDVPKHQYTWNFIVGLPFGKGKRLAAGAGPVLDRIIGGWQFAGTGSLSSTWWALPTSSWWFSNSLEVYGTKYPIQDCRSGTCLPGYLYYNGYIPANRINSYDASGKPNGVMGVPSSYKPAFTPLIPMPANGGSSSDPLYAYYDSNTVWVGLKNGTPQRTTFNNNLNPWRNQWMSGLYNWSQNASLFKMIPVREQIAFRLNIDFFNVFNMPGIPKTPDATTGIINAQNSGNGSRALQFGLRLNW